MCIPSNDELFDRMRRAMDEIAKRADRDCNVTIESVDPSLEMIKLLGRPTYNEDRGVYVWTTLT